tara:strand:- start:2512 stop:2787 length:276 start_codon:yes stop_codon:yes gene_type:complete
MVILNHRNASGVLDEDQPCPRKVKMIDKTDYAKTAQKAANDGMETFLNWGKAAIDNTFSMYEQGIAAQESNIAEARKPISGIGKQPDSKVE